MKAMCFIFFFVVSFGIPKSARSYLWMYANWSDLATSVNGETFCAWIHHCCYYYYYYYYFYHYYYYYYYNYFYYYFSYYQHY